MRNQLLCRSSDQRIAQKPLQPGTPLRALARLMHIMNAMKITVSQSLFLA